MAPRLRQNPLLARKIATLRLRLSPLYPLPTGRPHSAFPRTLLGYHLLTEPALDALAHHYSQRTPDAYTFAYPAAMGWDADFLAGLATPARVAVKRRKFGKFVGLRGCETPKGEVEARIRFLEDRFLTAIEEDRRGYGRKRV